MVDRMHPRWPPRRLVEVPGLSVGVVLLEERGWRDREQLTLSMMEEVVVVVVVWMVWGVSPLTVGMATEVPWGCTGF